MSSLLAFPASAAPGEYQWHDIHPTANASLDTVSAISSDGSKIYLSDNIDDGLFYSSDNGATWTQRSIPVDKDVTFLATNAAGDRVVIIADYTSYFSTDSGQTWSAGVAVGCRPYQVSASDDTMKLIAGCGTGYMSDGYIYTSVDGGASWTQRTSLGSHSWYAATVSGDGTQMAVGYGSSTSSQIYTSTDDGATWTTQSGAGGRNWAKLATSQDGSTLIGLASNSATYGSDRYVYSSTDSGVTWTQLTAFGTIDGGADALALSPDGQTIVVVGYNQATKSPVVMISTDGGSTIEHQQEFDFNYQASDASISADAQTIVVGSNQGSVILSSDGGSSWDTTNTRAEGINWTSVATDARGRGVWLGNWFPSGPIQHSPDGGLTWTGYDGTNSHDWDGVAVSAGGEHITAAGGCSWSQTPLHVSNDNGQTWQQKMTDADRLWDEVAMSSDGRVQAATVCYEYIYISTDYGQTWSAKMDDSGRRWTDVLVSSDGKYITGVSYGDGIYYSSDSGQSWSQSTAPLKKYYHSAMTADAKTQYATVQGGSGEEDYLYRSNDYGQTWAPVTASTQQRWQSVAVSADGTNVAASTYTGTNPGVYISTDSGATWTRQLDDTKRYELAMSADGTVLYAISDYGVAKKALLSDVPVTPSLPTMTVFSSSRSIMGNALAAATMTLTVPVNRVVTSEADVNGEYTLSLPSDVSLKAGDILTLTQTSAAGVESDALEITVVDAGELADTGIDTHAVGIYAFLAIAVGAGSSVMLLRRSPARVRSRVRRY